VLSGRYDAYIRQSARAMGGLGFPIALRMAHEMNGYWYPWALRTQHAHNTAQQYVAMWRHVWQVFHDAGVHNVIWVWSPNVVSTSLGSLKSLYPGDAYVDWVGVSGYLLKTSSFQTAYGDTIPQLRAAAPHKPWIITETAVGKTNVTKGVANLFDTVLADPDCIGLVWFDLAATRADWRFDGRPRTLNAIRQELASDRFLGQLPG
jgi:beta-mannanase